VTSTTSNAAVDTNESHQMHTFAHVDAQAIYLQLTTERTGRWKTSLDQLQMCASNANVMSLSKWSSSSVSITAWVERFSWQLFGPGCSAFSLLFREAHLFLLGPIISRAPLMVLLRVTKCTECGDDGTDGWGLALLTGVCRREQHTFWHQI
jgi:hypothetical protein